MRLHKLKVLNLFNIVLVVLAVIQLYLLIPLNSPAEKYISLALALDKKIKLIPGFIILYLSIYFLLVFLFVAILRKKEGFEMTIFLVSLVFLWSFINLVHGAIPTINNIRPEITEPAIFFQLVNDLYDNVKPYKTLPNWHVATAVLCGIAYAKLKFRKKTFVFIWIGLICLSPIFLKMAYLADVLISLPLAFLTYSLVDKISSVKLKTETVSEIVKVFSLDSLVQSVAIGIRDESTLTSLIEGLTRVEKNLTDKDRKEIEKIGSSLRPPVGSLKDAINNLILSLDVNNHIQKAKEMYGTAEKSYSPSDRHLKHASEELINEACSPFDNPKFRYSILDIKKRNNELINTSSVEEAAKERSHDIVFRFKSFIESHKKSIPVLKSITTFTNGHLKLSFDEIKVIAKELRKPPYEISVDEVWNAFYRIDSSRVKPLGELSSPANIISLTQFAIGIIDMLEPFVNRVDRNFNDWIISCQSSGKAFTPEEMEWLTMMKNHVASFLEINMISFNQPPFINKGGASKAYNLFGHDLNRFLYELNEKLT